MLKADTAPVHEAMHVLMGALDPFADRSRYARFVWAQLAFQREVESRCQAACLATIVPDLGTRSRTDAAQADLHDLRSDLPEPLMTHTAAAPSSNEVSQNEWAGLGWLYVSEGSTLGAAFLLKEAQSRIGVSETYGARHLGAAPQGRMRAWRAFVDTIDSANLHADQRASVIRGAHAAFAWFALTLRDAFADLHLPIPADAA